MCSTTTPKLALPVLLALTAVAMSSSAARAGAGDLNTSVGWTNDLAVRVRTPTVGVDVSSDRFEWRVRGRPSRKPKDYQHVVSLKYGTFDPDGPPNNGGFFGLRTGVEFDNRLTVAFNLDYYRRSFTEDALIAEQVDPNGNVIQTRVVSLDTSSNLIPLGVSLGLRLPSSRTLSPYVGVAVAYEVLINEIRDYEHGIEDTQAFGGPGWQLYGGLMLPITSQARLLGELIFNDAEVSRDVERYSLGLPVRETVDVSGFGARFGVEFHFD